MLHDDTVNAVRAYPDIVQVMSSYMGLKKRGRNYIGLCPFHSEKTPSFNVTPEKRFWHCFGCHESGDLIAFIRKIDNLSFSEAVIMIAGKVGIEVKEILLNPDELRKKEEREVLLELLYEARCFFQKCGVQDQGAMRYLQDRGVKESSIDLFSLGFAPSEAKSWERFKSLNKESLIKTGLYFQTDGGHLRPRFVNRIVFPIIDHLGRTIGFGGRQLITDRNSPKYINSPETDIFQKSHVLYGLYQGRTAIKKQGNILLVEGYMDVVITQQFGFYNSVATMGTAVTLAQVQLIKRYTDTVTLALDSDEAGQQAMEKSIALLQREGVSVKVLVLKGKDPAEYLLSSGNIGFSKSLEAADHVLMFLLNRACQKYDISQIENVAKVADFLIPYLNAEKDSIVRHHFANRIADRLNIELDLLLAKLTHTRYNHRRVKTIPKVKSKYQKAAEYIIYFSASDLDVREKLRLDLAGKEIQDTKLRELFQEICKSGFTNMQLLQSFEDDGKRRRLGEILMKGELEKVRETVTWEECLGILKEFQIKRRQEEIKAVLKGETMLSDESQDALLEELNRLVNKQ